MSEVWNPPKNVVKHGPMTVWQLIHRLNPWHTHRCNCGDKHDDQWPVPLADCFRPWCKCGEPYVYLYCAKCLQQSPSTNPLRQFKWSRRHACEHGKDWL